jgi:hypothetical protein
MREIAQDVGGVVASLRAESSIAWTRPPVGRRSSRADVVDEIRMLVRPRHAARERAFFEDSKDRKLVDATGFENGVVLLRYEIKTELSPHLEGSPAPAAAPGNPSPRPGKLGARIRPGFDTLGLADANGGQTSVGASRVTDPSSDIVI